MKKAVTLLTIFLVSYSTWAEAVELSIASYTINGNNITNIFNNATINWESKRVIKTDIYGYNYNETVYQLEIKLHNVTTKSIETIFLTEGTYAGGYAIYFREVIFPQTSDVIFRCEYYENTEDGSKIIYFYDTNSESIHAYAVLELR